MLTEQEEGKVRTVLDAFDNGKSITDLNETSGLSNTDIMEVTQGGESKKVSYSTLKNDLSKENNTYNVTLAVPLAAGVYYTKTTARAAVPSVSRKLGLVITYSTAVNTWYTERFIGSNVSGWTTESNWEQVPDAAQVASIRADLNELAGEISAKSAYQVKLDSSTNIYPGKEQGWVSATAIITTHATLSRCIISVVQGDRIVFDVPNQSNNGGYFYCFTTGRETDKTPDTTPISFWNQHGVEVTSPLNGYFQFNVQRDGISEGDVTVFKYIDDTTAPKRVVGMLNEELTAIPSIDYDVAFPSAQNGIIDILDYDIKLNHRGVVQLGGTMTRRESTIVGLVGNELEHIASAPSQGVKLYLTVNTDTLNVMNRSLVSPKAGDHITAFAVCSDSIANIINPEKYSSFDLRISIKGSTTTSRIVKPKLTDIKKMTNGRYGIVWDYEITAEDITLATTHIACDGILIISAVAQTFIVSMPIFVHTRGKVDIFRYLGYLIQQLSEINTRTLTGKKWDQLGDSTTAMPATGLTGYVPYIFRKNYFQNCKLSGVGGSTVGGSSSTAFWQDSRVATIRDDADLVTISGGINDFAQNIPIGTEDSTDTSNFAGGLNTLLSKLFTKNVNYKIAFIAPYYINCPNTTNRNNSIGLGIIDYVEMAEKVCARWGVPVRALHKRINVNPMTVGIYTQDTIHPNAAGYRAWGEDVAEFFGGL